MTNFWLSLLIGVLGLDTTIAFQVLLSQPIFSCSILGWVMGDFQTGVEVGVMLQLLWLYIIPAGGSIFPEGNIASMITCVVVIQYHHLGMPNVVFVVAFILGIAMSYLGAQLTVIDRKLNVYILDWMVEAAQAAQLKKIALLDILSILVYLMLMSLLAYCALELAAWLMPFLKLIPQSWEAKLIIVKPVVWGIGIALTIPMIFEVIRSRN